MKSDEEQQANTAEEEEEEEVASELEQRRNLKAEHPNPARQLSSSPEILAVISKNKIMLEQAEKREIQEQLEMSASTAKVDDNDDQGQSGSESDSSGDDSSSEEEGEQGTELEDGEITEEEGEGGGETTGNEAQSTDPGCAPPLKDKQDLSEIRFVDHKNSVVLFTLNKHSFSEILCFLDFIFSKLILKVLLYRCRALDLKLARKKY